MVHSFSFTDSFSLEDFSLYLQRAATVGVDSARFIADSSVLAVYTPILSAKGLLDAAPTVLGLRTFALAAPRSFDLTIPLEGIRVEELSAEFQLPQTDKSFSWAGITPPRSGWLYSETVQSDRIAQAAAEGIAEIAASVAADMTNNQVHEIRSAVWGVSLSGVQHPVPLGVAFAALSLGFIAETDPFVIHRSAGWCRLTNQRGHVLCRTR